MSKRSVLLIALVPAIAAILFGGCNKTEESDDIPPNIVITFPSEGSVVSEIVSITCMAIDKEGISKVALFVDGYAVNGSVDSSPPYELDWNTCKCDDLSSHVMVVRAYDENNNVMDSDPVTLIVDNSLYRPQQVNLNYINYINNTFTITWPQSCSPDFYSYALYESMNATMTVKENIYISENLSDTAYSRGNVQDYEIRYYCLEVCDSIGLITESLITKAIAIPEGDILFKDNFSGDLSSWDEWSGDWSIEEGQLFGIGWGGAIDAWIYAGDEEWVDYEVSFSVYFQPVERDGDIGRSNCMICLRSTEHWEDEYIISVFPLEWGGSLDPYNNRIAIHKHKDGEEKPLFDGYCSFPIGNKAAIRAMISGPKISLFIDDKFAVNYIDADPLSQGRVGLGVTWTLSSKFDDVVVVKK